jgi:hypothetical protein
MLADSGFTSTIDGYSHLGLGVGSCPKRSRISAVQARVYPMAARGGRIRKDVPRPADPEMRNTRPGCYVDKEGNAGRRSV